MGAGEESLLDAVLEGERELLLATMRRHDAVLQGRVSRALSAAADELVDPLALPTLRVVDDADTVDALQVVRGARARLQRHAAALPRVSDAMAAARAARELAVAEAALNELGASSVADAAPAGPASP